MAELIVNEQAIVPGAFTFRPWFCCARLPGSVTHPDQLNDNEPGWYPAQVPGTVTSALHAGGWWNIGERMEADAHDWWYRTEFAMPCESAEACILVFEGLATLAEIWLNGRRLLTTDNMFRSYRIDASSLLRSTNRLVIGFRSLAEELKKKRPRPRWKTNLVSHQQLRWHRTTLLGRTPAWSPAVPPVGPWRPIRAEASHLCLWDFRLSTLLEGSAGICNFSVRLRAKSPLVGARLQIGGHEIEAELEQDQSEWRLRARLRVPDVSPWWPHTHGEPFLYPCTLLIDTAEGQDRMPLAAVGFRKLEVCQENGFEVCVNGVAVYCRGACWTTSDLATLTGSNDVIERDLYLARDAGMNMIRVGGTMVYESDRFYELCDQLGILVWQDFMFANMDYPVDDPSFAANIRAEAEYQLTRLSRHPSIVVYCGNSEVEQQAAMLGVPRELWRNRWFAEDLPRLCAELHPGTAYIPSSPTGGVMPFHLRNGICHFYGIGAYRRLPGELRTADIKFGAECMAFANIPEPETVAVIAEGAPHPLQHPNWKQRVPRDAGADWDFEDVRDFYVGYCFGIDPVEKRSFDSQRYLELSRLAPGEMMSKAFSEWRSGYSRNGGGLIWFFKDLWPAAGWGLIDSRGLPKAAYYYLRRCWRNRLVVLTDEGLDGLHLHVTNETPAPLNGTVEVLLLKDQHIPVVRGNRSIAVEPRGKCSLNADEVLDGFCDVNYAYRFGPRQHDTVIVTLFEGESQVLGEAFYFLRNLEPTMLPGVQVNAHVTAAGCDTWNVTLRANHFLHAAHFEAAGFLPEDNYFHLPPHREKVVSFRAFRQGSGAEFKASLHALNLREPIDLGASLPNGNGQAENGGR